MKKCKDCPAFVIVDEAINFGTRLWEMGEVHCEKYGYKKAFKNTLQFETMECVEEEE